MRKLLVAGLFSLPLLANEISHRSLQSDSLATPLHDRGLFGQGQIIAILDAGVDIRSCYFAEGDNSAPPVNTITAAGELEWRNVDPSRRKIIAYDFLYSCAQYPAAPACEDPQNLASYANHPHGTHAAGAAAGDKGAPLAHDYGDALATGAKLVVQDAGFLPSDACTLLPGIGCPVRMTPILEQAYRQGARIHSNSWGDRQGNPADPPRANYSASARDIDAFVAAHPDMLVIFNSGQSGADAPPPASSLSAPGVAKNALQVGGTRGYPGRGDDMLAGYSLVGPSRDGRIKPDLVGPAYVIAADAESLRGVPCDATAQPGTSWASPTIAGAAALVRQYFMEGFYPSGTRITGQGLTPSAALLKATLIASARPVPLRVFSRTAIDAAPVPSYEQGFGFPVLDDALYFAGDRSRMRVEERALAAGEVFTFPLDVRAGTPLKAVLVWTDPPGVAAGPTDSRMQLVHDLDLTLSAQGTTLHGNEPLHPGQPDRVNNVEGITVTAPASTRYTVTVSAHRIAPGARQSFALVITGDLGTTQPARRRIAGR